MPVAWTLEFNGAVKPLEAWGIRRPRLTFRNLDIDELSFEVARSDVLAAQTFPSGSDIVLRRNGIGWFRGKVRQPNASGSAHGEFETFLVQNAWSSLARTVYQQQRCVGGIEQYTPRVTLGANVFGQKISVGRQIFEITQYALTKGVPVIGGLLPEFVECWKEEARDLTCAGAIRTVLRLMPNVVGWFDYTSGGAPIFNAQENTFLTPVTIDALAKNVLGDFSISPRSDLVPTGVTFIYESNTVDAVSGRTMTTLTRDFAGAIDIEGSIVALIELAPGDTQPPAAAAAYYSALQAMPFQGTVRTLEEDCTGTLRPGKVVNITNARPEWAAMRGVIQIVTEDLFSGETVAEIGPPEHLAPQDFIQQQQIARKRSATTYFPTVQPCVIPDPTKDPGNPETGTPPAGTKPNPDGGVDPKAKNSEDSFKTTQNVRDPSSLGLNTVTLSYCDSGNEHSVTVYAPLG